MSCEDLPELEAKLKEAAEQEARDLLVLLQSLPITFTQLCTSKIRKTVKRIYKKYLDLQSVGKELIGTWKKTLSKERLKIFKELSKVVKSKELAAELEGALHLAFTKADYTSKFCLVLRLLKNKTLKERLLTGELTCSQLIQMKPAEADANEEQQFEYNQFNQAPLSTAVIYKRESVMVRCHHCGNPAYTKTKPEIGICSVLAGAGSLLVGQRYYGLMAGPNWWLARLAWLLPALWMPCLRDVKHYCRFCEALLGNSHR
jgi:hypothetical protein